MLRSLRNIFITGIIILLPIAGSIYIIYIFFNFFDNLLRVPIEFFFNINIPGIGVLVTIAFIFIAGLIARNYLGTKIINWTDNLFKKIPILKTVYISIKQIVDTLYLKREDAFKKVVLVEYPRKGLYTIGFVTSDSPSLVNSIIGKKSVSVFIPTTPNPTSGMLILAPEEDLVYLNIDVEYALKMIVSGGLVTPDGDNIKEE